jgi:hypothetical protein
VDDGEAWLMARVSPAITSLNAGELGPTLEGRTDLAKYPNGLHRCENFIPLVQGPAQRRAGTRFTQEVKDSGERVWIRRFEFSATQAYILEFGDQYLRFYTNHGALLVSGVTAWSNATDYVIGDLVAEGGVNYYCIQAHTNQQPPDATYWYPLTGSVYEIPTPYALADLTSEQGAFALDVEQSGDVLYIAGAGAYVPMTLTRFDTTDWVLAEYIAENGPFMDQNKDQAIVMWASAQSGSVTLRTNTDVFAPTDVDRLVRLQSQNFDVLPWEPDTSASVNAGDLRRFDGRTYKALNTAMTGVSPPIHDSGVATDGKVFWEFQDAGYGIAQITAYTSATQVTATVLTQLPADAVGEAKAISGITQADPAVVTATAHGFTNDKTVYLYGVVGMTQVNNQFFRTASVATNTFALATIDSTGYGAYVSGGTAVLNATMRWSLGAWSDTTGYPNAVAFAYDRLWWAKKLELYGSVPAAYTDMSVDFAGLVTPDAAIRRTLTAQDVNEILWLVESDRLLIGTPGGEFALGPITTVDPLGPDNVQVQRQSKRRCHGVRPAIVGTSVVYVQRAGRRLLLLDYAFEIDRFRSANMNALNAHITRSGIVDMAYQAEPDPVLWCVLANGSLIAFTLDQEQDATAWHRHPIGGNGFVETVETIPSPDGGRDEVWVVVRRTINGQTKRYVEFIERPWEDGDDQADVFYLDSGLTYDGAPATIISGLDHLEGQAVQVAADGASHPNRTVSGGQIELAVPASTVQVGLACPARLVTMRIEAGSQDGTSQGKVKRTHGATVRLHDTLGGKIGMEDGKLTEIQYRRPSMPMDQPPEIFTGDKEVTFDGDYETDGRIEFLQDQPFPATVVGIYPRMVTYDARK